MAGDIMVVREITAKSILSKSQVFDYALNAYVGCQHACVYCYAKFMKRFTGHHEPWGEFVDVKVNAPELLAREVARKKKGNVWISGVCDAYQPLERRYKLTRMCIEILADNSWPFTVQTKSPLVTRDIDLISNAADAEVGFSITTADEKIRKIFEPYAPTIRRRVEALGELHDAGIRTFVMIAPLLPGAEGLVEMLAGKVDNVLIDRMNYHHADRLYKKHGLTDYMSGAYFEHAGGELCRGFGKAGVGCRRLY